MIRYRYSIPMLLAGLVLGVSLRLVAAPPSPLVPPLRIQAAGTQQPQRKSLNFTTNLTVTDDPTNNRITVAAAGGSAYSTIKNAGSSLTQRSSFNVDGTLLLAADNAGATRTDITAPGLLPKAGGTMTGAITFSGTQLGTYTLGGTPTVGATLAAGTDNTYDLGSASHTMANVYSRTLYAGGNVMIMGFDSNNGLVIGNTTVNIQFGGSNWYHLNTNGIIPIDNTLSLGSPVARFLALNNSGYLSQGRSTQSGTTYTTQVSDGYVGLTNTAARTITLIAAASTFNGYMLTLKDEAGTATGAHITVNKGASDTIDGASSASILLNYGVLRLMSDGTSAWFTM